VNWRAHLRRVDVNGRSVNLVDIGEGPALVFVHGLGGSWQNWLENIPAFARSHRVIALDLPGFGESELPAEDISISGYGRTVDALLDGLGIERAAIVGNSMGGFIGAEVAMSYGTRVDKLVLVSAAGLSIEHQQRDPLVVLGRVSGAYGSWLTAGVVKRSRQLARRPGLRRGLLWLVVAHPEKISGPMTYELVRGAGKPGFLPALDALTSYPIRDRLPGIRSPTLIVWGTKDMLVPVRDAAEFERLIPNARKDVWPDTGHLPMVERPARFNAALAEFLSE
jgi:pimeloyl-ACP methyl ester carboxylesterase